MQDYRRRLMYKFPWIPATREYFQSLGDTTKDFFSKILENEHINIYGKVAEFFKCAFEKIEYFDYKKDSVENVYLFLALKILINHLDSKGIAHKIANLYSKIFYADMIRINKEEDDNFTLFMLCQEIGLDFIFLHVSELYRIIHNKDGENILKTHFKIHLLNYLEYSPLFHDESRKLINQALDKGYIYITPKSLIRFLQEHVRKRVFSGFSKGGKETTSGLLEIPKFKKLFDEILVEWRKNLKNYTPSSKLSSSSNVIEKDFPPCIKDILLRIDEGENLPHTARFMVASFLLKFEYLPRDIDHIFTKLPDYNPEKTQYQLKNIVSKNYESYGCKTAKSNGLCKKKEYDDKLCLKGYWKKDEKKNKKITHPSFYASFLANQRVKKKRSGENRP